nr:hypothetical protein CFP56_56038 [Quercus suber]
MGEQKKKHQKRHWLARSLERKCRAKTREKIGWDCEGNPTRKLQSPLSDAAGGAGDFDGADAVAAEVLAGDNGEAFLVVVDGADDATDGGALDGGSDDLLALDAEDVHAVGDPVEGDVGEDDDEADEGNDVGDAGVGGVGDGALDRGEDGAAGDAHDEDAGAAARVAAEVGGAEREDGRVHGRFPEEEGDEDADGGLAGAGADVGVEGDGEDGVDGEEEGRFEDGGEAEGDEAADGEGDEAVREHLRGLGFGVGSVLRRVVDEEGGDGDLSTDVAELGDQAEDHVVLLVERCITDDLAVLVDAHLEGAVLHDAVGAGGLLLNLGKLGEEEEDGDGSAGTCDGEVDVLHVGEVVGALAAEESLGGDEWADETRDTVPSVRFRQLRELETRGGCSWVTDDDGVGVGSSLQGGETAGDDKGASQETTEAGFGMFDAAEMSRRPEHDGTDRVESQTHEDGDFVAFALEDFGRDRREAEITTAKVHDLETGGFESGHAERVLEMLVENTVPVSIYVSREHVASE